MTLLNTGKSQSGIRTMHSPFLRVVPNARPPAIIIDDIQTDQDRSTINSFAIAVVLICAMAMVVTVSMSAAASVATLLIQHR